MNLKTPKYKAKWGYFDEYDELLNRKSKPILQQNCCSNKEYIFNWVIILLFCINLIAVIASQNKENKENEIKIKEMQKEIEKMIKEQNKIHEQIKSLAYSKAFYGSFFAHTIKNFEEKFAAIEDKENNSFDRKFKVSVITILCILVVLIFAIFCILLLK
uniref:Uncharacterized protein n=2 Tax=Meloidogyne TaxID=189290 RepID=A0A6V7UFU5_MELEN|nr:unnamed protein product [Meloidogyne enterolobii]